MLWQTLIFISICIFIGGDAFAGSPKAKVVSHSEPAHVHGEGQLNMAFEGKEGRIEIDAPGDSILGFEHKARSEKDKAQESKALSALDHEMAEAVILDPKWKCEIQKSRREVTHAGKHCDVEASYKVSCAQNVEDGVIEFRVQKKFPFWRQVKVQLLTASTQKSQTVTKNGDRLEVK